MTTGRCLLATAWLLAAMAGCAPLGSTFAVDPYLKKEITGDTFGACAARAYRARAAIEARRDVNYITAARFVEKAKAAQRNEHLAPWGDEPWLPAPAAGAQEKRDRLLAAFSLPARDECACGTALARYDGWLADAHDPAVAGPALEGFEQALKACGKSA